MGPGLGSGTSPPTDRSKLEDLITVAGKNLGEGGVVTFVGFIVSARNTNVDRIKRLEVKNYCERPTRRTSCLKPGSPRRLSSNGITLR